MTPDDEAMLRLKLRHLRQAHHHLALAAKAGTQFSEHIVDAGIDVQRLIIVTTDALKARREAQ